MNPVQAVNDLRLQRAAANAGRHATTPDPESFLTSVGMGLPDRLRVPESRAQSELCVAEATTSSLKIQIASANRDIALQPNTIVLWFLKLVLFGFEAGTIGYIFTEELGYPAFTAASTAVLYTTGTFYLTRTLFHNFTKPKKDWAWYTIPLFIIYLLTGASLIVLRLANRSAESTSLTIDIASALILAFVSLLPGWQAAKYGAQLKTARELNRTAATMTIEQTTMQSRVAALREGIDATRPEDFELIDRRARLRAIYEQNLPPTDKQLTA